MPNHRSSCLRITNAAWFKKKERDAKDRPEEEQADQTVEETADPEGDPPVPQKILKRTSSNTRRTPDPAAVAYDGVEAAIARGADLVIIDTAGRLHTKVNLMEELKKINRSVSKKLAGAPQETLLVLDATTGQNALSQARLFNDAIDITALALTHT